MLRDILEEHLLEPLIYQISHGYNKGGIRAKDGKTPTLTCSARQNNNLLVSRYKPRQIGKIKEGRQGERIYSQMLKVLHSLPIRAEKPCQGTYWLISQTRPTL